MPLFPTPPSSICILRLSAIGDCCHALALVHVIQREWPQTRITWITGKIEATLFADLPGVEVIPFDKSKGWRGYRDLWQTLKGRKFDALLHLQAAMRASIATLGISAKVKLGFDRARANDGQWLFTNHKVPSPASRHVQDGFLAFAKELGIKDLTPNWQLPISAEHQAWAKDKIGGKPTLLICAAASKAFKNWTAAGYAALADHAADKGFQVYLCGGPAKLERDLAADIQRLSQSRPVDLVGQTNLKQLLALIGEASLVLAPDTGPTHMAHHCRHAGDRPLCPPQSRSHRPLSLPRLRGQRLSGAGRAGDRQATGRTELAHPPQGSGGHAKNHQRAGDRRLRPPLRRTPVAELTGKLGNSEPSGRDNLMASTRSQRHNAG